MRSVADSGRATGPGSSSPPRDTTDGVTHIVRQGIATSAAPSLLVLDTDQASALPRADDELVFAEPWEARAFGMAISLHDAGLFAWPQFQAALIARIAAWENHHPEGECYSYYAQWLGALEDVLAGDGTVFTDEVVQRAAELAIRHSGRDHTR
ncbi:nitrile hydratase accessory protein [Pseudonocardia sp.]|jgi:nitrile hydratase accessory protein|uniref:nitrile hydratase accessory protein n=1 Tax=Pseudonocardia sp. TaxID=60912 RepID=UPI003D126D28